MQPLGLLACHLLEVMSGELLGKRRVLQHQCNPATRLDLVGRRRGKLDIVLLRTRCAPQKEADGSGNCRHGDLCAFGRHMAVVDKQSAIGQLAVEVLFVDVA